MPVLLLFLTACCGLLPAQPTPAAPPAYRTDPKFLAASKQATDMKLQHQFLFQVDALRKANKIAGGACRDCLEQMYQAQMDMHDFKGALGTAQTLEQTAANPRDKSVAETMRGVALLQQAGNKPKPEQLQQAQQALAAALADFPRNNRARWSEACVLARMGRMDEAGKDFAACAEAARPTDPLRIRAQHFAQNPALSLQKMAPAFEVTALDGTRFNLDDMGGRVVLLDFWATWCGPCNAELPHLKKIAKEFAGEPLVILSISWDKDETAWKSFLEQHEMTWTQYRDADHALSDQFDVNAIPHYFTIDADGVLTAEMMGSGSDVEGKLKKLLARARERPAAVVAANRSAGEGANPLD